MTFKVGSTRDLRMANGEPAFTAAAFEEFERNPDIEWEWIEEDIAELTPDIVARYDAIHVNTPVVSAQTIARDDCRVKLFARAGVGFDSVDVAACAAKGILVTNTPFAIRRPVAVAALTLIFALAGRLIIKDRLVRTGAWMERTSHMGQGLTSRVLGLIGAGGIGQELIPLARPFFQEIVVADPYVDEAAIEALDARKCALAEVLAEADFVLALCPLNDQTRHMMGADAFRAMKRTASFINVARGPVHDEAALVEALRSGQIAGAALDVTETEPLDPGSPLTAMENVILTPHALCWTDECFEAIARSALRSIADVSLGVRPESIVSV